MSQWLDEVDLVVKAHFTVKDFFVVPEEAIEYRVSYENRSKQEFVRLYRALRPMGFTVRLSGTKEEATLEVRKSTPRRMGSLRIPSILFLLAASSILVSGWIQSSILVQLISAVPFYFLITAYTLGLLSILIFHEVAHQYAARSEGTGTTVPYFLPGLPISPLPTFGAFSFVRDPPINRDSLFKVAFVGPIVGIAFACVVAAVGSLNPILLSPSQFVQVFGSNGTASISELNLSVLQTGISSLFSWAGLVPSTPRGYQVIASPATAAAWTGLAVCSFALLPALGMDGGHLSESIMGYNKMRLTTYLTVISLVLLDTPNYFLLAILILLIAGRAPETPTLDEISEVSKSKKALFATALVLVLLTIPIPLKIGIFPLS